VALRSILLDGSVSDQNLPTHSTFTGSMLFVKVGGSNMYLLSPLLASDWHPFILASTGCRHILETAVSARNCPVGSYTAEKVIRCRALRLFVTLISLVYLSVKSKDH